VNLMGDAAALQPGDAVRISWACSQSKCFNAAE